MPFDTIPGIASETLAMLNAQSLWTLWTAVRGRHWRDQTSRSPAEAIGLCRDGRRLQVRSMKGGATLTQVARDGSQIIHDKL